MSDNDPFGLGPSGGGGGAQPGGPRTVVAPTPGGAAPGAGQAGLGGPFGGGGGGFGDAFGGGAAGYGAMDEAAARPGVNPLVDAAAPILELAVYLSRQIEPMDLAALRSRILALMSRFGQEAQALGQHRQVVDMARYALSATLDDVIMSRPWDNVALQWGAKTLGSELEGEVTPGDRFFHNLELCLNEPRAKDLLELKYICLSLGFKGRYRRADAAKAPELEGFRKRAFQQLSAWRGGLAETVADHWPGVPAPRRPLRDLVPLWLIAALSIGLAALAFVLAFTFTGDRGAMAVASVNSMPLQGETEIVRYDPPAEEPVEIPAPPPPAREQVQFFLQPEIDEGLVQVYEDGGLLYIRIVTELAGRAMFASGKAVVQDDHYRNVLTRVAAALNDQPGEVIVQGHTDSIPPSRANKYPSNYHLSVARAEAAMGVMAGALQAAGRMTAEGLGDQKPIATNQTREGRARNRRVEIVLVQR
ncbi:type IVB secretion system protein IcmH/DotU [Rhodovulum sp. DZ06]|uniref:type IVB secretion system protein IcmH/DotU n=1 Tax=Rhodovulum sp. DZ06 TaxID=3425126 RepID=UPI003D346C31